MHLENRSSEYWISHVNENLPKSHGHPKLELPVANCSSADWVSIGITCIFVPRLKLDPIKSFSFEAAARLTIVCLFTFRVLERTV